MVFGSVTQQFAMVANQRRRRFEASFQKLDDTSALSGKQWRNSPRTAQSGNPNRESRSIHSKPRFGKMSGPKPLPVKFIEPMKARLAESPPRSDDWIYEIKFDGFRALAFKNGKKVQLLSRNEKDFGGSFLKSLKRFPCLKLTMLS